MGALARTFGFAVIFGPLVHGVGDALYEENYFTGQNDYEGFTKHTLEVTFEDYGWMLKGVFNGLDKAVSCLDDVPECYQGVKDWAIESDDQANAENGNERLAKITNTDNSQDSVFESPKTRQQSVSGPKLA